MRYNILEGNFMELEILYNGMLDSNSYLLVENNEAVLIDAGVPAKRVLDTLIRKNAKLKHILLTHGHIDHICSADEIRKNTGASILIHGNDSSGLTDADKNLSSGFFSPMVYEKADGELRDGDVIELGRIMIKVIHTPGHSKGGCCFFTGDMLFSGDTLFAGSIGRTDFIDGSYKELISSIKEKLLILPERIKVYPGHGYETTISNEANNNPFLNL